MNERIAYTAFADIQLANRHIFEHHFPSGTIESVALSAVPKPAMEYFESKSKRYLNPHNYIPKNFSASWIITHENGDQTYVAKQTKWLATPKETETLLYLVDMRGKKKIGFGWLYQNISKPSPYFIHKPLVGYTCTVNSRNLRRKGLGTRRLFVMNALSQMVYGHPLNSDTDIEDEARGVWQKLVRQGFARAYKEGRSERYVFR